ncbi:hypothetical protein FF36_00029 [Frankia torreyi]|uniref:Uncharacterized protein n=1 Tax=Frankia torreyi TaxID=1856 RepID=A0A0D8BMP2_9ACTN|nr:MULTISPECIES: hypothetical protein [Frankia]KJE25416.1 hypothetical protein FF36_00029 [Frankia torreyi]
MTPGSLILGLAERMIRLACRRLPEDARDERYREWTAELPAILHDPDIRSASRRALRVLLFAADQHRGIPSGRVFIILVAASQSRAVLAILAGDAILGLIGLTVLLWVFHPGLSFGLGVLCGSVGAPIFMLGFVLGLRSEMRAHRGRGGKADSP